MSLLLLHPEVEFDFEKNQISNTGPHTISIIGLVGAIFVLLLFSCVYFIVSIPPARSHISLKQYNVELNKPKVFGQTAFASPEPIPSVPRENFSADIPVLMYHYTPNNFEEQLQHLQSHGYQTVSMREVSEFLYSGTPLPYKPVVITFDDGFEDQLKSFALLEKYKMKATYYIILGGERSNYCIGLSRTNLNCGDSYLNWTQLKTLHDSGLIEIGAHTLNHPDLPSLAEKEQLQEILESKNRLEDTYNIAVTTFAYPYGKYDQATIELVKKTGFLTAVTTHSDTMQSSANRYTLPRVRNALLLP